MFKNSYLLHLQFEAPAEIMQMYTTAKRHNSRLVFKKTSLIVLRRKYQELTPGVNSINIL
jgi:hypothetical protein